jgi:uncharacterized protein YjiS (DUF1127 family)
MFTSTYWHGDTSPHPSGWLARIARNIASFWSRSRRKRHTWVMSAELKALDDRMLKDIGLQRLEIESTVPHSERLGWYVPPADTVWAVALIPQSHRAMTENNLAGRQNSDDI